VHVVRATIGGVGVSEEDLERALGAFASEPDVEAAVPPAPWSLEIAGTWPGATGAYLELHLPYGSPSLELLLRIAASFARTIGRTLQLAIVGVEHEDAKGCDIGYRAFEVAPDAAPRAFTREEADEASGRFAVDNPKEELHVLLGAATGDAPRGPFVGRPRRLHVRARLADPRLAQLAAQLASAKESSFEDQKDGRVLLRIVQPDGTKRITFLKKEEAAALRATPPE
jgi:hypothetical protein